MEYSVYDQEADIQREIELTSPMISEVFDISTLEAEYSNNPNFLRKIPVRVNIEY